MVDSIVPLDAAFMDSSVKPTADFYRYANGGWLESNPVPPEYGSWGAFHEVLVRNEELLADILVSAEASGAAAETPEGMVGNYYASGMDVDAIEAAGVTPIQQFIDAIDAIEGVASIRHVLVLLHGNGLRGFFGSFVAPDFDDSSVNLMYLGQGGLGLPERDYYLRDDEQSVELRRAYETHIEAQLVNLGFDAAQASQDAAAIVGLETSLAAVSLAAAQLRDVELTTNKHSLTELAELTPTFRLDGYLQELGVDGDTVNIDNPRFFASLDTVLEAAPAETVRAYLRWHLIRSTAASLPAVFEDESFGFYGRTLGGQQEQKVRWKRVLSAAGSDIGEQVSQLYVATAFSPAAKAKCEELVDHLLVAMKHSIDGLDWMGLETKEQALAKLSGFVYKIGYPDEWRDYSGLEIDRVPYLTNRLRAAGFEHRRNVAKLDEPVDEKEWAMAAHVVNAYYHPLRNEIVFPAGLLQPPFFYPDADDAINYGAIGAVIGHEITHGFDDQGSRFDAEGHLRNWWTDEDRSEFDERAGRIVDQFDDYLVAADLAVNGQLTLGENIADLGGITIAYAALLDVLEAGEEQSVDGFTAKQRFFLSYATVWRQNYTDEYLRLLVNSDPHSPSHFRCNGPLSNFAPFREAFPESDGESMLRSTTDMVEIW